MITAVAD